MNERHVCVHFLLVALSTTEKAVPLIVLINIVQMHDEGGVVFVIAIAGWELASVGYCCEEAIECGQLSYTDR